jgi:hypothetical protein
MQPLILLTCPVMYATSSTSFKLHIRIVMAALAEGAAGAEGAAAGVL